LVSPLTNRRYPAAGPISLGVGRVSVGVGRSNRDHAAGARCAQDSQICTSNVLIGIEPTSAHSKRLCARLSACGQSRTVNSLTI
jgi:hypothetical protein